MRPRKRLLLCGALLAMPVAMLMVGLSFASGPTIEATSTPAWSPSMTEIALGETVTLKNPSTSIAHGVEWTQVPSNPDCTNVPGVGQTNWTGSCSFNQAGTYKFVCVVHGYMTGTVNVTGPSAPTVSAGSGTPTSDTEVTLAGIVKPNGLSTEYFFEYGTAAAYGKSTDKTPAGSGFGAVNASANLEGLVPGTTYHFQFVAENSAGTRMGGDRTFTTHGPPSPTTESATGIFPTRATLHGSVNPNGHQTTYFFEYGTDALYGHETAVTAAGSGTSPLAVSVAAIGLEPETQYHFRLVAENSGVEVTGQDQTFTTASFPPPPPPPPTESGPPASEPDPTGSGSGSGSAPPQTTEGGPALGQAVKLAGGRHARVTGSVQVLGPGAGGRLKIELESKGESRAVAGRTALASVPAGTVPFSVALNAHAKRALRRSHRLVLTVWIELIPLSGAPVTVARRLVLRSA